ncbi:MAG: HlyD family type I secretion periplasmic adaptor subunit [Hyphomicrobium sp.]
MIEQVPRKLTTVLPPPKTWIKDTVGREVFVGTATTVLIVFGLGYWAAATQLAGAVVAPGTVVVQSFVKKIQHPTGGVVGEIKVRDGDEVHRGDVIVRLDDTVVRANLGLIDAQLDHLKVRRARLEAERDGSALLELGNDIAARAGEPEFAMIIAAERTLMESRGTARQGQKAQLAERVSQLREQIAGLETQHSAKQDEIAFATTELGAIENLWRRKLTPLSKIMALRRDHSRLKGESGQLKASIAQAREKITETELQADQIDQDLRAEVTKELREVQAKIAELEERRAAAEDQLMRIEIRAPIDGVVNQLVVHTIGGVVNPGESIMQIVPKNDNLILETHIAPKDIDQVRVGQDARIRFTAFDRRTTPEFNGQVVHRAADLARDQVSGQTFYVVQVALNDTAAQRDNGLYLVPGMPGDVFIHTGERSALSFLVKPLEDQLARAFRER